MSKVSKVTGSVGMFNKTEAIAVVCIALNNNADVLIELMAKVDRLENEVKQLKGGTDGQEDKK